MSAEQLLELDPSKVSANPELRGRKFPPTTDDVKRLAESIKELGQLNPIQVRRSGKAWEVVTGYTRLEACKLLQSQGHKIKVKCVEVEADELQALKLAVVENYHRKQVSPIDTAYNHQMLRERYALNDLQIAELYGMNPSSVTKHKRLLRLSPAIQRQVHDGKLAYSSAVELAEISPDRHEAVLAETGGKLPQIQEEVRKVRSANMVAARKQRTPKQIVDFLAMAAAADINDRVAALLGMLRDFAQGKVDEAALLAYLHAYSKRPAAK